MRAEPTPPATGTVANLAAMRAVIDDYGATAAEADSSAGQHLAPDCVLVDWSLPEPLVGRDVILAEAVKPYRAAFPEGAHEIEDVITDGTRLVILARFTGRFENPYGDLEPTGRVVSWAVRDVWTFADGLASRIDIGGDTLGAARALTGEPA